MTTTDLTPLLGEVERLRALLQQVRDHVGEHGDGEIDAWSLRELLSHNPEQDHTNCTPGNCAAVTAPVPGSSQHALEPDEAAIRVDERADIARQLELLAADEALIADWVTTCDPIPLTVPDWLRALAGKIRAGDPDPGPALELSSPQHASTIAGQQLYQALVVAGILHPDRHRPQHVIDPRPGEPVVIQVDGCDGTQPLPDLPAAAYPPDAVPLAPVPRRSGWLGRILGRRK